MQLEGTCLDAHPVLVTSYEAEHKYAQLDGTSQELGSTDTRFHVPWNLEGTTRPVLVAGVVPVEDEEDDCSTYSALEAPFSPAAGQDVYCVQCV
jgi:hypothetical protein